MAGKNNSSIGIDIGTAMLKMVKLKFSSDKAELFAFQLKSLKEVSLEAALKDIAQKEKVKKANFSVSAPAALLRYVEFPKMNEEELSQAMRFEAANHFPYPVTELNLDSFILKEGLTDNKMLVLLAAVKKDFLKERLRIIRNSGIEPDIIDVDSIALINAFNYSQGKKGAKNKTVVLINLGAAMANLNILEAGIPVMSRDIHIDLNPPSPGQETLESQGNISQVTIDNLANEIVNSFDYYESQTTTDIASIFLSGGNSLIKGLKEKMASILNKEVLLWDPLENIEISSDINSADIKPIAGRFAVAIGLALRD